MDGKQFVRDYLSYSRRERVGLLVLIVLNLLVFLLPAVVNNSSRAQIVAADTAWIAAVKKLQIKESGNEPERDHVRETAETAWQYDPPVGATKQSPALFYFDPNTLSEKDWTKLGLRDKTIQTIQKYLAKGGHFYTPEDLKKVYGLREPDYERLAPYVRIQSKENKEKFDPYIRKEAEIKRPATAPIDINTADTTAFIALPGIGSKLAARIVNFREKLGGFYSIEQLKETYGIQDSTFQQLKPYLKLENTSLKKININTAGLDELKNHPYIKYGLAKPMIAYRNEHGPFASVEGIKKVMAVTPEIYSKVAPYLSVE